MDATRMINKLRPWVIRESAADGRTLHGYTDSGAPKRFWTRAGATAYAYMLAAPYAGIRGRKPVRYRIMYRLSDAPIARWKDPTSCLI